VLNQHVFFQVRDVDRGQLRHRLCSLPRHVDRQHAVELLVHQSEGALTVTLVLSLVYVFHDQNVVLNLEGASVEFLTADVADTYV